MRFEWYGWRRRLSHSRRGQAVAGLVQHKRGYHHQPKVMQQRRAPDGCDGLGWEVQVGRDLFRQPRDTPRVTGGIGALEVREIRECHGGVIDAVQADVAVRRIWLQLTYERWHRVILESTPEVRLVREVQECVYDPGVQASCAATGRQTDSRFATPIWWSTSTKIVVYTMRETSGMSSEWRAYGPPPLHCSNT